MEPTKDLDMTNRVSDPPIKVVREITLWQMLTMLGIACAFMAQQYVQTRDNTSQLIQLTTQQAEANTRMRDVAQQMQASVVNNARMGEQVAGIRQQMDGLDHRVTAVEGQVLAIRERLK